jgi:O-antigen biosynthesis protein
MSGDGPSRLALAARRRLRQVLRGPTVPEASVPLGGRGVPFAHPLFQIGHADIAASRIAEPQIATAPESVVWLVPWWRHLTYGGIHTIFRFVSGFAARGLHTRIVIYDNAAADLPMMRSQVLDAFPELAAAEFSAFDLDHDDVSDLPGGDIAICTFWASAYLLLRYRGAAVKYYFIQDYEPYFYPTGPAFALAESTYRFGFRGIVNTPGLFDALSARHGVRGMSFVPAVDARFFYPTARPTNGRLRVFFFARPAQARNGFELGVLAIKRLLRQYGDRIQIVTAGSVWDERAYGLGGRITNVGLLDDLHAVGQLYRGCDIGFAYSLTKHPSYQPLEFMASGMATVTNRNEDTLWLLEDGVNCLLAEPSPTAMSEKIGALIEDPALRANIARAGIASVSSEWDRQVESVWSYLREGS